MRRSRRTRGGLILAGALVSAAIVAPLAPVGSAGAATSSAVGVTSRTIKLGITYVDLSSVQQFVHGLNQGNYKAVYQALIDNINSHGGINGRKIEPYYVGVSPLGTASPEAACTQLTEDDQVFAVTGFFQNTDPLCYVQLHSTPMIGGVMTSEMLHKAKAAWFSTNPIENVLEPAVARAAAKDGVFKKKKVAVISQADAAPGLAASVIAALKKSGVKPVATAVAPVNANDPAASQQVMSGVIAQKFQSAGANVVVAVGNAGQSWPNATSSGTYHPTLVATSNNSVQAYATTSGKGLAGSLTGYLKPLTVGKTPVGWSDPSMQKCVHIVEAAGQHVDSPLGSPNAAHQTFVSVVSACQNLTLFEAVAKHAGKHLNDASFERSGDTLGSLHIPAVGTGVYSKATPAGVFPLYVYHWDTSTNAFVSNLTPSGTVG